MQRSMMILAVAILTLTLVVGACSKPTSAPTSTTSKAAPTAPIKLRYTGYLPPDHHATVEQKWFAAEVEKRTSGRVTVPCYVGGELFKTEAEMDAVVTGAVEMAYGSTGRWSVRNPVFGFYNYFFLMASNDHAERASDELGKVMFPLWEALNVKPLHWVAYGDMAYCGRKPMVKPADIKGMLIRGTNAECVESLKALGAVPASIDSSEVYDALTKGAIDGAISGWSSMYSRKWYEVAKYFSGPFFTSLYFTFINLNTWKALPNDIQQTILQVAKETEKMSFKAGRDYDIESIATLKKAGNLTLVSSPEDIAAWSKFAAPSFEAWLQKCEKAGYGNQAREVIKVLDKTR